MPGRDGPENLRILKKSQLRVEIGPCRQIVGDSATESNGSNFLTNCIFKLFNRLRAITVYL